MSEPAGSIAQAAPAPGKRRRAGWKRWLLRLLVLAVVLRLLLAFTLSWLIELGLGAAGLEAQVGSSSLSLLGGHLRLEQVEIREPGGFDEKEAAWKAQRPQRAAFALGFDTLDVDLETSALLTGTLRVSDVLLEELRVVLVRDQQGWKLPGQSAPAQDEPVAVAGPAKPEATAVEPSESSEPPSLRLPIEIDQIDVHPFHVRLLDGPEDRFDTPELDGTLRVANVGEGKTGEWHLRITGPGALDVLRVDGTLASSEELLDATLGLDLAGLRPDWLARFAAPATLRGTARQLDGHVRLAARLAVEPGTNGVKTQAHASLLLTADGREVLALDKLEVLLQPVTGGPPSLSAMLAGLRGSATARADGALAFAGLDLLPAPPSVGGGPVRVPELAAEAPAPAAPEAEPPPIEARPPSNRALVLESVQVADVHFDWNDERRGGAKLALELPRLALGPRDGAPLSAPVPLALELRVPGVCESLTLEGQLVTAAEAPAAELKLHATGLTATAADPWLASAGWASELSEQAELSGRLGAQAQISADGRIGATLQLRDLRLVDGEERLALAGLVCERVGFEPGDGFVHVSRVDVSGPVVAARRDAQGVLHVAGLRSVPKVALQSSLAEFIGPPPPVIEGPPLPPTPAQLPHLLVNEVLWHDAQISLLDEGASPPVDLALRPALQVQGLSLGRGPPRGTVAMRLDAPAAWESCALAIELHAAPAPAALGVSAQFMLADLHAKGLAGWMRGAGLEPPELHSDLSGTLHLELGNERTDIGFDGLSWTDGGETVLRVPKVRVLGIAPVSGGTNIESIELPDFQFTAARAADGALLLGKARFAPAKRLPPPADAAPTWPTETGAPAAPVAASSSTAPETAPSPAPPAAARAPVAAASAAPASSIYLGSLRLGAGEARLNWRDDSVSPPVATGLQLAAEVDALRIGAGSVPARVSFTLRAPEIVERAHWEGTLALRPGDVSVRGELATEGLRLGPLAAYLPPGCTSTLQDGRLSLKVSADAGAAEAGGERLALQVSELSWRDGEAPPMLAMEAFSLSVSRLDPAAGVAVVDEVALTGLQAQVRRTTGGAIAAFGLQFGAPAPAEGLPEPAPAGSTRRPVRTAQVYDEAPRPRAPPPYRDVSLGRVDLELRALTLTDESGAGGKPLVLASRLSSPGPLVLLDRTRDDLPPAQLTLHTSAEPVMRALDVDVFMDLAAVRQSLKVDVRAEGLRGDGITEVMPELAEKLDGSGLADGSFTASLFAELGWPRRGPLDFDTSGGISGEVTLSDVALRPTPEAEPALGLHFLEVDLANVRPGARLVHLSSVELDSVRARIGLTQEAFEVAGLKIKRPPAPPPASPAEGSAAAAGDAPPPEPVLVPAGPLGRPLRLQVDQVIASGLDVLVRDDSCTPPMLLPITDLDAELRSVTSGFVTPPPMRFSVSLRGGSVPLPRREKASSTLAGVVGAAAQAMSGRGNEVVLEPRPVFEELSLNGRWIPSFPYQGWANLNLSALELPAFAGPAARGGVLIGDGTLDATMRVRANGEDGSDADLTLTFTHLSLAEPENGPISQWLRLPAPLDTVLFLLRNDDGEHVIPANFHVAPGGLGTGEAAGAATSAIGSVIARAVASAPMRLLTSVTDLVGVTGGEGPPPEPPVLLEYAPGDPSLPASAHAVVSGMARKLADDEDLALVLQHDFGTGDADVAATLGTPTLDDARRLVERLGMRRAERQRLRDAKAAEARALLAVGRAAESAAATQEMIGYDRDITAAEDAQDRVLTLMDPGAARRAPQRTRAAGVEFGRARLDEIKQQLAAAGGAEILQRVELRPVRFVPSTELPGGRVTLTLVERPQSGGFFDWLFGWIPDLFSSDPEPES